MSIEATAEADRTPLITPTAPWRVRSLKVLPGYRLAVTFQDGTQGIADLAAVTSGSDCGIYAALADSALFQQASLELGVVTWPNGADLDPAWMHEEVRRAGIWAVPL